MEGRPTPARLERLREETGLGFGLVVFFQAWPEAEAAPAEPFPAAACRAARAAGAVPCLTWEPMVIAGGEERAVPAAAVLDGAYDAYIDAFARGAREYGGPVLLRFAHEMNLQRYHWGTTEEAYGPRSPALYAALFRYVAGRCRAAGARNLLWVFCPNAESVPAAPWNRAARYYPGDEWVDLLGMDGYNWGSTQRAAEDGWTSSWRSFAAIFGPLREELMTLAPAKPLLVCETASVAAGGDKAEWLRGLLTTARAWELRGVVWFEAEKEEDWRLRAGAPGAAAVLAPGVRTGPGWLRTAGEGAE
jgi:hypothetical protein